MPMSSVRRTNLSLLAAATATAAVALAPLTLTSGASAADSQHADAQLVRLDISSVPPLHATLFHGIYGTASSPTVGGEDPGDFSDPDGVLNHVTITGNKVTRTSNQTAKVYAQSQNSGMTVRIKSTDLIKLGGPAGSVSTLDTYAECTPPPVGPYALAYARTAADMITVVDRTVTAGTTRLAVTGAELGEPGTLGNSTLTVNLDFHEEPSGGGQTPGVSTARAWVDIRVTGVLNNTSGAQVYSGPIVDLRLGQVEAVCDDVPPSPSPSPSPTSPSPDPSPTPSPTSPSPVPSPTRTETPTPPTPPVTSPYPPYPSPPTPPGPPQPLPRTGSNTAGLAADALLLLGSGAAALAVVRVSRRRGRH